MEALSPPSVPAGWYTDPHGSSSQRYWDGSTWTSEVRSPNPSADQVIYVEKAGNGLAVAALVTGIVGLVLALIPLLFFVGWGLGITAFVLGLVARSKAKKPGIGRKTMATWGVVLGLLSFGMGSVGYSVIAGAADELNQTANCLDQADTLAQIDRC